MGEALDGASGIESALPPDIPMHDAQESRGDDFQRGGNDTEERARARGWKPQDEFSGRGEWVDAESFMRKQEEKATAAIPKLESKLVQMNRQLEAMAEHQKRVERNAEERGYKRRDAELAAAMDQAVELADKEGFRRLNQEREELRQDYDKRVREIDAVTQPHQRQMTPKEHEYMKEWVGQNQWYTQDRALSNFAVGHIEKELQRDPYADMQSVLNKTAQIVRQKFPEELGINTRRSPQVDETHTSRDRVRGPRDAITYNTLPREHKGACDNYANSLAHRYAKLEGVSITEGKRIAQQEWISQLRPEDLR